MFTAAILPLFSCNSNSTFWFSERVLRPAFSTSLIWTKASGVPSSRVINPYPFSGLNHSEIEKKYRGKGYAEFKIDLAELLIEKLTPIQKKYQELSKDKKSIFEILHKNAKEASLIANKTLREVKKKMGFLLLG
jgi:hypothetical protein